MSANVLRADGVVDSDNSKDQRHTIVDDHQDDDYECWDDARQEQDANCIASSTSNKRLQSACAKSNNQTDDLISPSNFVSCGYDDDVALHEAVFRNDMARIDAILNDKEIAKQIINRKDKHGNTALHLACMLGRSKDIVSRLLQCGASVDCKNLHRWTPFHEACSYGDREIIGLMTQQLKDDVYDALNKNKLSKNLEKTKNYRLVLKWEFQSWVPLLARVLPSDTCVINKQGKFIRIDTSLLDFEMLSWKRGECSLIYSRKFEKKWIIMNNKTKKYQNFETQNIDHKDIDSKVDEFMSTDILDFELKSSDIQLTRSTSGWIWKADKMEKVGKYNTALYTFDNVFLITRKRREHLSDDDVKRNKLACKGAMNFIKNGEKPNTKELEETSGVDSNDDSNDNGSDKWHEPKHRESLPRPTPTKVTWEQYCNAKAGEFPSLGRPQKCKTNKTAFKASVAMSEEFPITKNDFLDLLSIVPLKLFKKLKDFIELRLPEGFPIRLDIPIYSFLTARITFEDFAFIEGPIDESLFSIPSNYENDPNLFPFLSGRSKDSEPEP